MRYHELIQPLSEAPLASYDLHGDFDQPGSHTEKDRRLASSPKAPERLSKMLRAGYVDIAVHVANMPLDYLHAMKTIGPDEDHRPAGFNSFGALSGTDRPDLTGMFTSEEIKKKFGLSIVSKPDEVTVVILGNSNGDHALTAWMIIHRLTHMIEDAADIEEGPPRIPHQLIEDWKALNHKIRQGYRLFKPDGTSTYHNWRDMGTTRSMLNKGPVETANEFLTQYLVAGRVTLNPIGGMTAEDAKRGGIELTQCCDHIVSGMYDGIFVSF